MTATAVTLDQVRQALTSPGSYLNPQQFTFSIPGAEAVWPGYAAGSEPFTGYSVLNPGQATQFRAAIAAWDAVIRPDFTEVADTSVTRGEIRAAFTAIAEDGTAAYAYLAQPRTVPGSKVGDIWIDNGYAPESFAAGTYNYELLLHEIGHAIGLAHPFERGGLPAGYENRNFTVMSYSEGPTDIVVSFAPRDGRFYASFAQVRQTGPMVLDIAAAQSLYGAEPDTATGDTIYRFDQAAATRMAIYDAGGIDTFDLSDFTRPAIVDLAPGAYSTIGLFIREAQAAQWSALYPQYASFITTQLARADLYEHRANVGIAFSTVIENATGGAAADTLSGNDAANRLDGGVGADVIAGLAGDDVLIGGLGADALDGGAGSDTADYSTVLGAVFINLTLGRGYGNAAEGDTLTAIENVTGSAGNDTIIGDGAANRLDGGAGDDVLRGAFGADLLVGGAGADTASYEDNQGPVFVDLLRGAGYNNSAQGDRFDGIENLFGSIYTDVLIGSDGANRIDGGDGDDLLIGALGADVLAGGAGDDTVSYEDNQGAVIANLTTGRGNGNAAEGDSFSGVENLTGTVFYDTLTGDAGANRLDGRQGADMLTGGGGADLFLFSTALDGVSNIDTITDFASGVDRIALSAAVFAGLPGGALAAGMFALGSEAQAAAARILYDPATGALRFDADGAGGAAAVHFASVTPGATVAAADFVVV